MRIALNVDFELESATGVSRYGAELARQLSLAGHLAEIWMCRDRKGRPGALSGVDAPVRYFPFPRRLTDWIWPRLRRSSLDLDAVLCPAGRLLPFSAGPQAAMVHDLGPFLLPGLKEPEDERSWQRRIRRTVRQAALITVNSRSTLKDLSRLFPEAVARTVVTPLGIDHFSPSPSSGKRSHLLAVGTLEPRKNYTGLIRAYHSLCQEDGHLPPLVIAGKDGFRAEEVRGLPAGLGIADRVLFTGYVGEQRLEELYRDAACLVHPALREGFGFTVPEAFAWGLPVAASSGSATEELFHGAVELFDPASIGEMAAAVRHCLDAGVTPKQQARRGELFEELTWKSCAALTLKALEEAL